ncbi:hypothetical protein F3I16_18385 [Pseudomonas sp. L-22-4S-12]|uniref:hypothetical protein n=1 Tax=Pseudomonas sp. L-22-4S-12 TaxID=2610893 RepID=UPI00132829D0|nr:hypothetical protein [Pseudomonas sp. L-22-4S-12]MWV18012.1 hypothetical protein [Pseudomonas sp. L-22-4S-12]
MNHLEQLTSEWYEYRGYFVRRNVLVGKRAKGGYECELDVVAFCPQRQHLVHIEPSMDAHTWAKREARYEKKFEAGRKYIPGIFSGITLPKNIEQIALLGFASNANVKTLAGGRIMTSADLLAEITAEIGNLRIAQAAIPEQYPLLRTIQFAYQHRHAAGWR